MRRIDNFIEYMKVKNLNDNQVTKETGLSVGLLNQARKGKTDIGMKTVEKLLNRYQDLSRVWLLTGEGEMLIPTDDKGNLIADNGAVAIPGDKATVHLSSSNPSTEIQLLQQRIKHLEELLAEKEHIIQLLERIASQQKTVNKTSNQ